MCFSNGKIKLIEQYQPLKTKLFNWVIFVGWKLMIMREWIWCFNLQLKYCPFRSYWQWCYGGWHGRESDGYGRPGEQCDFAKVWIPIRRHYVGNTTSTQNSPSGDPFNKAIFLWHNISLHICMTKINWFRSVLSRGLCTLT